ncbi:hypothetical protein [Streptomyces glaucosporus]
MARGSTGEDPDRGLVRRRRWIGAAVTCAAAALAVVHVVLPDLKIDNTTVVLLAIAVLPWLGDLFDSIELPGGAKLQYKRLEERIGAAEERATRLDQEVDGAAATARVALAAAGVPDRGAAGEVEDPRAEEELGRLVAEYVRVRASMPSGPARTARQEHVFAEMLKSAPRVRDLDVDALLGSEDAGERLAAIARLYAVPDPAKLGRLVDALIREELPFLSYWGVNVVERLVSGMGPAEVPIGIVQRMRAHLGEIPADSGRAAAFRNILAKFEPPGTGVIGGIPRW